jgi:hypothetical protein
LIPTPLKVKKILLLITSKIFEANHSFFFHLLKYLHFLVGFCRKNYRFDKFLLLAVKFPRFVLTKTIHSRNRLNLSLKSKERRKTSHFQGKNCRYTKRFFLHPKVEKIQHDAKKSVKQE